jgi:hypothetical protein
MSAPNFAKIPEALLFDADISHVAVRVYGVLLRHSGKTGEAFPGRESLAKKLGVHIDTIRRALCELVDAGWIERTRRPGTNVWDTTLKASPEAEARRMDASTPRRTDASRSGKARRMDASTPRRTDASRSGKARRIHASTSTHGCVDGRRTDASPEKQREPMNESQLTRVTAAAADAPPSAASDDVIDAEIIDELPLGLPTVVDLREPDPVQVLVGAYVTAVEATGGIATKSQRAAIGANAKRLINDDHIELPIILIAVQRAGTKRARTVDPFLGDLQSTWDSSANSRNAMRARWYEIAAAIDAKGDAS